MQLLALVMAAVCALAAPASSTSVGRRSNPPSKPNNRATPVRYRSLGPRRLITVSVLNDRKAPVRQHRVDAVLREAFAAYAQTLNIVFEVVETLAYDGDLTLFPVDQAFLLQRMHTQGEIRIIFSNSGGREDDAYMTDRHADSALAGGSHPYFGHVILYNVEVRAARTDAAGHSALSTALKHELGHLFGLEHSDDMDSFMYTPSCNSRGQWTEEVVEQINRRREKHWFPNA